MWVYANVFFSLFHSLKPTDDKLGLLGAFRQKGHDIINWMNDMTLSATK